MEKEQQKLKDFIETHFDFYGMNEAGFWPKGTRRTDYDKIAARVCQFFGFESVYEYGRIEMNKQTETVSTGSFPAQISKEGELIVGGGFILHVNESAFVCPVCTCPQDANDHTAYRKAQSPCVKVKCKGCNRKMNLTTDLSGRLIVTEDLR